MELQRQRQPPHHTCPRRLCTAHAFGYLLRTHGPTPELLPNQRVPRLLVLLIRVGVRVRAGLRMYEAGTSVSDKGIFCYIEQRTVMVVRFVYGREGE